MNIEANEIYPQPYAAPELVSYGAITAITAGGSMSTAEANGTGDGMRA